MVEGEDNVQDTKLTGVRANTAAPNHLTPLFRSHFCVPSVTIDRHAESLEKELCILRLYSTSRLQLSTKRS